MVFVMSGLNGCGCVWGFVWLVCGRDSDIVYVCVILCVCGGYLLM